MIFFHDNVLASKSIRNWKLLTVFKTAWLRSIIENFVKKFNLRTDVSDRTDPWIRFIRWKIKLQKFYWNPWSYYQDSLTWCVQSRKPFPKWKNIFKVCRDWHEFMVAAIACVAMLFILEDTHPKWRWLCMTIRWLVILILCKTCKWPISCRSFSKACPE